LYLDGVQLTNGYTATYSGNVYLDGGSHKFDIEYYNTTGAKNVAFTITPTGATSSGGAIGYGQDICSSSLDPPAFQSLADAGFCSPVGTLTYTWQMATNPGGPWTNIPGTNSPTYDPPAFDASEVGTYYFRREYFDGSTAVYSNVLQVLVYQPEGDQTSFGINEWIGYVYNDEQDWVNNYRGYIIESTNFDESFCGNDCFSDLTAGCPVRTTGFSILFKNRATFECGTYLVTVGGDDGVRLIVDGVMIPEFDKLTPHSYTTYSKVMYFDGTPTDLELYYFESGGSNRVSFSATFLGPGYAGTIAGDDYSCITGIDPGELTSVEPATSCAGAPITYQWQSSLDGLGWTDIPLANSESYDPPGPLSITTYYRRQAIIDGYALNSNVVTVEIDPPQGDETTFGQNYWIGYVYDSYTPPPDREPMDYHGYMIENTNFDRSFCGPYCTQAINGCDVEMEDLVIRYKNEMTLECGNYRITIGFNDGGRLSIDGVPVIGEWWFHGTYTELTTEVFLEAGTHQFVYDYLEGADGNRVSFNIEYLNAGTPALIGNNRVLCSPPYDPLPLTQFAPPTFACTADASPDYQWQISTDQVNWSDIPLANGISYDPPAGHTYTRYYRRKDTNDVGEELFSNVVTIAYNSDAATTDGSEFGVAPNWIAHVYDGFDNYSNYQGSFVQTMVADAFDQSFCGPDCIFPIDGCDIVTNTFTVQFQTQIDLVAGEYTFTIGSAGAARLTISGGELASPVVVVDDYSLHYPYGTVSNGTPLELQGGTYSLVLDYTEEFADNRVSFSYTFAPLPVTWYYFNGYYADGRSFLEWRTASEIDNQGFGVEHSINGTHFANIGWVDGHGNSTEPHEYKFVHDHPALGWNYYRLKQVDYDGKFEYSRLIPVFADDLPGVEIFPNPLNPNQDRLFLSRVNTDQPIQVMLTSMIGQEPFELKRDPMMPSCFVVPERLAPGLYHVRIQMGDAVHTRKLVIE
jgi:hypothetical protein